jgi:hypothetical protein
MIEIISAVREVLADHNLNSVMSIQLKSLLWSDVIWGRKMSEDVADDLKEVRAWLESAGYRDVEKRCNQLFLLIEDYSSDYLQGTAVSEVVREMLCKAIDLRIGAQGMAVVQKGRAQWFGGHPGDHNVGGTGDRYPSRWWKVYSSRLIQSNFSNKAIEEIRENSVKILNGLHPPDSHPLRAKGLVIGYIQSGKTASMAGVIALAADAGYNMFVILSGTKENLRQQTQKRLVGDLQDYNEGLAMNLLTSSDEPGLSVGNETLEHHAAARLSQGGKSLGVVLKYKPNLTALRDWLRTAGAKKGKISLLLIDDEADQAGSNANAPKHGEDDDENLDPTTINKLIRDILNGHLDNQPDQDGLKGRVAYLAYTATPFANVLNESGPDSLYPDDLVWHLPRPSDYFGAQEYCGDEEGRQLDVIRRISDEEAGWLRGLPDTEGDKQGTCSALQDAVAWFLLATAEIRLRRADRKPHTTMLIHLHHLINNHKEVLFVVGHFVDAWKQESGKLSAILKRLYVEEAGKIDPAAIREVKPDYSASLDHCGKWSDFEALRAEVFQMLEEVATDGKMRLRIVVDNSEADSEDRLGYPEDDYLHQIVIGGATLARGLTFQQLVSSYFCRPGRTMDTLLQMGRWYGYRFGYEDLPRVWITDAERDFFEQGALIEREVYDEVDLCYREGNFTPKDFGIRIRSNPGGIKLTNHMRGAAECGYSYAGKRPQTISFKNDVKWLQRNWNVAEKLYHTLSGAYELAPVEGADHVFRNVDVAHVLDFLSSYQSIEDAVMFVSEWQKTFIEENRDELAKWSIVFKSGNGGSGEFVGQKWNFVRRSKSIERAGPLNIGTLISAADTLSDYPEKDLNKYTTVDRMNIRFEDKLGPLMVIYPIHKDSPGNSKNKMNLEAKHHVLGASLMYTSDLGSAARAGKIVQIHNIDKER